MNSSARGKKINVRAAQTDLNRDMIFSVISLCTNPRLPTAQLIDFLWLITCRATFAIDVEGFVSVAP